MQNKTDDAPANQSASILYVDDETLSLKHFRMLLAPIANVYTAKNPLEAWQVLNTKSQEIGVIVSDQRMPFENGLVFLNDVKRQHAHISRVLFSAFLNSDCVASAIAEGAIDGFIEKPCPPEIMIETLGLLLRQQEIAR